MGNHKTSWVPLNAALLFAAKGCGLQDDSQKGSSSDGAFNSGGNKTRGSRVPARWVSTDLSSLVVFLYGSHQAQWILLWALDFPSALLQGTKFQSPFHCSNKRRLIPGPVETPKFVSFVPSEPLQASDTFSSFIFRTCPLEDCPFLLLFFPVPILQDCPLLKATSRCLPFCFKCSRTGPSSCSPHQSPDRAQTTQDFLGFVFKIFVVFI